MTYRFLGPAMADVLDTADWLNIHRNGLGDDFADEVEQFAAAVVLLPRRYGRVSRPPAGREIRQGVMARFLYVITYEVTATEIVIISVCHARRKRNPWRQRI